MLLSKLYNIWSSITVSNAKLTEIKTKYNRALTDSQQLTLTNAINNIGYALFQISEVEIDIKKEHNIK